MTVAEALRSAAQYVEANPSAIAWDRTVGDSAEDKARIAAEVLAIGRDLDAMAAVSEAGPVDYRQYETLMGELQRRGFFLTNDIARAIANAFHAQSGRSAGIAP